MTKRITIARAEAGDWEAVYFDGQVQTQGHSVELYEVLGLLGYEMDIIHISEDYCEEYGSFPAELSELEQFQTKDWLEDL